MKNKIVFIVIAILSICLSAIGFYLDSAPHRSGFIINAFQVIAMASLLFIFLSINFVAVAFCIRQIRKAIQK